MAIHAQVWAGKKHPVVAGFQVRAQQFLPIVNGHRELRCLNSGNICSQGVCASLCVCVCATPPRHVCARAIAIWFDNGYALPLNSTQARNRYLSPSHSLPFPLAVCDVISVFFLFSAPAGRSPQKSIAVVYFRIYKYFTFMCSEKKKSTKLLKNVAPKKRKFAIKEIYINIMHACIFICYINSLILLQNKSYKMQ